jgi:hypothetical protein
LNIPTIKDPLQERYEGLTVTTGATLGQLRRATRAFMQEAPNITEEQAIGLVTKYSEKAIRQIQTEREQPGAAKGSKEA